MNDRQRLIDQIHALLRAQNDLLETLLHLVGDPLVEGPVPQLELPFNDDEPF